jgi:hypothetical protein
MRRIIRWALVVVVTVHGLIHLLGAAKGLGWAEVAQLTAPIGTAMGAAWLSAGLLVLAAGVLLAVKARWWWAVAAIAAAVSQAVILTAWDDAAAGSAANVLLLLAAVYGYASQGPASFRAEYRRRVAASNAEPVAGGTVTESDLQALPAAVAAYIRRSGAVGHPRVTRFHAHIHGRIRQSADKPWMPFTAEQVNTYGAEPSRVFLMEATMFGAPVDVLHTLAGPDATMRAKVCSLIPVVDAGGPEMAQAETVTLLNDLCIFSPAALVDAPITWHEVDSRRVRAIYTNAGHRVTAELVFNDQAELVDFVSDDRMAVTADGKAFTSQRWSTPLRDYGKIGPYRLPTAGEGRWHPAGKPGFTYIELHLDEVVYNTEGNQPEFGAPRRPHQVAPSTEEAALRVGS